LHSLDFFIPEEGWFGQPKYSTQSINQFGGWSGIFSLWIFIIPSLFFASIHYSLPILRPIFIIP